MQCPKTVLETLRKSSKYDERTMEHYRRNKVVMKQNVNSCKGDVRVTQ